MKRYQIVATDVACAQLCTCFWAVVVLKIYLLSQPTLADSLLNLNLYIYIFMDREQWAVSFLSRKLNLALTEPNKRTEF